MMKRIFLALVVSGFFSAAAAAECPAGRSVPINEGHFGAKNLRAYNSMISLQGRGHTEGLREMVEGGTVVELPAGKEACIVRDVATSFRTRITIPGHEGTYWVHSSALDRAQVH